VDSGNDHQGVAVSALRLRSIDQGELAGAETLLERLPLSDEARTSLARLGGVDAATLLFGDGWAAVAEVDGTPLVARGEPSGADAKWTIAVKPGAENAMHAARKLISLVSKRQL
jgi:hypothetical protein